MSGTEIIQFLPYKERVERNMLYICKISSMHGSGPSHKIIPLWEQHNDTL
jgi:hypothetical protein